MVQIKSGICRSGRTERTLCDGVLGSRRRPQQRFAGADGGVCLAAGKARSHRESVGAYGQGGVMVEAESVGPSLIMTEAEFPLKVPVVARDTPAQLDHAAQLFEGDTRLQRCQPVLGGPDLGQWLLDHQSLFGTQLIAMNGSDARGTRRAPLLECNHALGRNADARRRFYLLASCRIFSPLVRQIQLIGQQIRAVVDHRDAHHHLTGPLPIQLPTVLACKLAGPQALLRIVGIIYDPRLARPKRRQRRLAHGRECRGIAPLGFGNRVMHRLMLRVGALRCHQRWRPFDALAISRQHQIPAIIAERSDTLRVPGNLGQHVYITCKLPLVVHVPWPSKLNKHGSRYEIDDTLRLGASRSRMPIANNLNR